MPRYQDRPNLCLCCSFKYIYISYSTQLQFSHLDSWVLLGILYFVLFCFGFIVAQFQSGSIRLLLLITIPILLVLKALLSFDQIFILTKV